MPAAVRAGESLANTDATTSGYLRMSRFSDRRRELMDVNTAYFLPKARRNAVASLTSSP
jgi:hypothetical protein